VGKNVEPASFSPEDLDLDPGELCQSGVGEKAGCIYRADEFTKAEPRGDDFKIPQLKSLELPHLQNDFEFRPSSHETTLPFQFFIVLPTY